MPTTTPDNIYYQDAATLYGGAATSATEASSIQTAFNSRQMFTFRWADASARTGQTGMRQGDTGYQIDTRTSYVYDNSVWRLSVSHAVFDSSSVNYTSGVDTAVGTLSYNSGLSTDNTFITSDGVTSGLLTVAQPGIYAIGSISIFTSNTPTSVGFRVGTIGAVPYFQAVSTIGRASFLSIPNVRVTAANTQFWFTATQNIGSTQAGTTQLRITRIA